MRMEKLKELLAQLIDEEANKEEEKKTETVEKSSVDQKAEKSKDSMPCEDCGDDQGHSIDPGASNNSDTSNSVWRSIGRSFNPERENNFKSEPLSNIIENCKEQTQTIADSIAEDPDVEWARFHESLCKRNSIQSVHMTCKRRRIIL